jgi:hypothetical protein
VVDVDRLLERLAEDAGYMALLSGKELEILAEMDPDDFLAAKTTADNGNSGDGGYTRAFLSTIQKAADRHLQESILRILISAGKFAANFYPRIVHKISTAKTAVYRTLRTWIQWR